MNLIKRWLTHDWQPVWVHHDSWRIVDLGRPTGEIRKVTYIIYYSKSLNEYKLKTLGLSPKEHTAYQIAVEKLNEFIENEH